MEYGIQWYSALLAIPLQVKPTGPGELQQLSDAREPRHQQLEDHLQQLAVQGEHATSLSPSQRKNERSNIYIVYIVSGEILCLLSLGRLAWKKVCSHVKHRGGLHSREAHVSPTHVGAQDHRLGRRVMILGVKEVRFSVYWPAKSTSGRK